MGQPFFCQFQKLIERKVDWLVSILTGTKFNENDAQIRLKDDF